MRSEGETMRGGIFQTERPGALGEVSDQAKHEKPLILL